MFTIEVNRIEEWQTLRDRDAIEALLAKARSVLNGGDEVILARKEKTGKRVEFGRLRSLDDLKSYEAQVLKYL